MEGLPRQNELAGPFRASAREKIISELETGDATQPAALWQISAGPWSATAPADPSTGQLFVFSTDGHPPQGVKTSARTLSATSATKLRSPLFPHHKASPRPCSTAPKDDFTRSKPARSLASTNRHKHSDLAFPPFLIAPNLRPSRVPLNSGPETPPTQRVNLARNGQRVRTTWARGPPPANRAGQPHPRKKLALRAGRRPAAGRCFSTCRKRHQIWPERGPACIPSNARKPKGAGD